MASSHAAKFRPFDPGDDTWAGIATRSRSFRDKESSGDQLSLKREDLSEESMIPPIPRYHRKRSKVVTAEPEVCDPMHLRSSVAALPESMRTSMVIPLCSSGAAKLTRPTEVLPRSAAERALTLTRSDAVYPARSLARLAVRHGAPALRAPRFEVLDDVTQFGENDSNGKFASLERAREEQRKTVPRAAHF